MELHENIKIRDYLPRDYNQLMKLWEITGIGGAHRGDTSEIITHSIELGGKLYVLEEIKTNQLIGCSWMTFDGRRIHLHHIGVHPDYQNKGYGKLLTRTSLKYAKEKGYQIKLEVHQSNKKAIEIYKKEGFSRLGDYDIYIVRNFSKL